MLRSVVSPRFNARIPKRTHMTINTTRWPFMIARIHSNIYYWIPMIFIFCFHDNLTRPNIIQKSWPAFRPTQQISITITHTESNLQTSILMSSLKSPYTLPRSQVPKFYLIISCICDESVQTILVTITTLIKFYLIHMFLVLVIHHCDLFVCICIIHNQFLFWISYYTNLACSFRVVECKIRNVMSSSTFLVRLK